MMDTLYIQELLRGAPHLVNLVLAVAYYLCLALPMPDKNLATWALSFGDPSIQGTKLGRAFI